MLSFSKLHIKGNLMINIIIRNLFDDDIEASFKTNDPQEIVDRLCNHEAIKLHNKRLRLEIDSRFFEANSNHYVFSRDITQEIAFVYCNALEVYQDGEIDLPWLDFRDLFFKESFKEHKNHFFHNLVFNSGSVERVAPYTVFYNSMEWTFKEAGIEHVFDIFMQNWKASFVQFMVDMDDSTVFDIIDDSMWVEMTYLHNSRGFALDTLEFRGNSPSATSILPNQGFKNLLAMVNLSSSEYLKVCEEYLMVNPDVNSEKGWQRYKYKDDLQYDQLCSVYDLVQLLDRAPNEAVPIYFGSYKLKELLSLKPNDEFFLTSGFVGLVTADWDYICYVGLEHDLKCLSSLSEGIFMPVTMRNGELAHPDHLFDLIGRTDSIHAEIKSTKGVGIDRDGRAKLDARRRPSAARMEM
jgi:hypothetical protein